MNLDELDRLYAAADPGPWKLDRQRTYARAAGPGEWVTRPIAIDYSSGPSASLPNLYAIVALHNAWPEVSARLRAAEAEVERLRGLVRWFLGGDDHTHEDDCGARGSHDLDVCRNTKPCADETCEGPHCTCDATEMRARARAALGEP